MDKRKDTGNFPRGALVARYLNWTGVVLLLKLLYSDRQPQS